MVSLIIGIIGIAVGAFITWKVANRYYKKASDDLIKEASDLRNLNILILRALENAGFAELMSRMYLGTVKYNHTNGGWYLWREQFWQIDKVKEVFQKATTILIPERMCECSDH